MKFLKTIYSFFCTMAKAMRAAELSRNGKYKEAQALYRS
jgi:hypothetical protein